MRGDRAFLEPNYGPYQHYMTNSFVHHDEMPPVAARLTDNRDKDQVPSEPT